MRRIPKSGHWLPRLLHLHGRLLVSAAIGAGAAFALQATGLRLPTRLLAGWNIAVVLYLARTYWLMRQATVTHIRRRAAVEDEGAGAVLVLSIAAAAASLVAVIVEIGGAGQSAVGREFLHGMGTIVLSWLFMHTIFALHYAHEYYGEGRDADTGGLTFPGRERPDYWDFLYFSFVVAMTSQVSDVAVTSKVIRRLVNLHSVASFFFNLSILALTINMLSNLIKPG